MHIIELSVISYENLEAGRTFSPFKQEGGLQS